ncbi:MAG: PadR family transcriptional regulator, partial [Candidatus Nitrosotenuis sp.]
MPNDWFQRVGSSIPRGFSRYFILDLLSSQPHTGKEIIDSAEMQTQGIWKPSPGLIYPLFGRLLDEGLVEEKDGKYHITKKGKSTSEDIKKLNSMIKNQIDVWMRVRNIGSFIAMDLIERINLMGELLSSNISKMTKEENAKYKKFLLSELEKLDRHEVKEGKQISID